MSEEMWALEWSHKQNCFHIQKICDSLASMQAMFIKDAPNDYKIIFIGPKESCHAMADAQRYRITQRSDRAAT